MNLREGDPPPENESSGALAGATGAECEGFREREVYPDPLEAATALCDAIRRCRRADAVAILSAALEDLRVGMPIAPFDGVLAEARLWAEWATPDELKGYALACAEAMRPEPRERFIAYLIRRFGPPLAAAEARNAA